MRDEDLLALAMEIGGSLDPLEVVRTILAEGARLAASDRVTLSSWHRGLLTIEASVNSGGGGEVTWPGRTYDLTWLAQQPLIKQALETRSVVTGDGLVVEQAAPEFRKALSRVRHTATVPLVHDGEVTGLLVFSRFHDPGYPAEDRPRLATLGAIAGLALRNARVHQEAAETARRLGAAERTKSELFDIAVHELRSPLTVIQGYAALLDSGDLGPLEGAAVKAVRVIAGKAREAQEIATTLLTVARLDSDELRIELVPFPVASLLERIHDRAAPRLALAGATFSCASPPELRALGDPSLVIRIMDNLVNNAITYANPPTAVQVTAARTGDTAEIRVIDRGLGVAVEDRERIFERFVRGTGAERASGTGLGLYVSRECARRMGGDLVLESSEVGEGSTFLLTLAAA